MLINKCYVCSYLITIFLPFLMTMPRAEAEVYHVSCVLANNFLAVSNIDATLQRVVVGAYKATVEGVELTLNFGL